jgi:hypothetical protein
MSAAITKILAAELAKELASEEVMTARCPRHRCVRACLFDGVLFQKVVRLPPLLARKGQKYAEQRSSQSALQRYTESAPLLSWYPKA